MAPAPMAITAKAANAGVASPMVDSIGATVPAVVIRATVEEPWAVLRMADNKNGNINPSSEMVWAFCLMKSTMEEDHTGFIAIRHFIPRQVVIGNEVIKLLAITADTDPYIPLTISASLLAKCIVQ